MLLKYVSENGGLLYCTNESSYNFTQLDPKYYYQVQQMVLLTYTTPLSQTRKMHCIKQLTTGIRYIAPIF